MWKMTGTQLGGLHPIDLTRLKELASSEVECDKIANRFLFWPDRAGVYVDYTTNTLGNRVYRPERVCLTAKESFITILRTLNFMNI